MKNTKRFLLILGMVACLFSLSACGSTEAIKESTITEADAQGLAEGYIGLVSSIANDSQSNLEEVAGQVEQYYGISAETFTKAVENYSVAKDEIGDVQSVEDITYVEEDKELTINATIIGSKKTASVIMTFELPKGIFTSMLTNVNYTFGEMMTTAGLNTVLGMGTVFCVLIVLMALISCFKFVNQAEAAMAKKKEAPKSSVDNAVAQIVENEAAQDDTELIAVIAAAIAASEGAASTDGYVVRSIRRRY